MPSSARSTSSKRRRLCIGTAAVGLLAVLLVFGNPLAGRASATTIPMVFPLEKRVTVHDDYLAPRSGHLHQGSDLMAAKMTKELACVSGRVTLRVGTYGGVPEYSLWLAGDDGHGYFYIHINNDTPGTDDGAGGLANAFAPGLVSGAHVEQGQWIANVGDSGNAESTGPHLHFEIHETTSMSSPSMDPHDSLVNAPLYNETPLPTGTTRYQQTDSHIAYTGTWYTFSTNAASGGSYLRAKTNGASATIAFNGTYLGWIATSGTTLGKAQVSLDGGAAVTIDLAASSVAYQQRVWNTGTLVEGPHTVKISWDAKNTAGKYISVDAIEVAGTLTGGSAPPPGPTNTRYEQTDGKILYVGNWIKFISSGASGGSYTYADSSATASIWFDGTKLDLIATTGFTQGKARVTLDGADKGTIDFSSPLTLRMQKVWTTGPLAAGTHKVVLSWLGQTGVSGGTRVNIDAVDVTGSLLQAVVTTVK
jgi:murein DD-endopeptidase MepM/ murein hydrolase activator NlpD